MRLISYFSGLLALLILAGSVAAARQTVPDGDRVVQAGLDSDYCTVERLVSSGLDDTDQHDSSLNPERISMLNWNIYKGQRDNWATDFKRYSYRHDLVIIQEAHLDDDLKSMLDGEHRHWTLNNAFHYKDRATGVMTAARVKPTRSCGQRTVEPLIRFPKTSLINYYPIDGIKQQLLVANIHGINFTLGVGVYNQQIDKLYEVMKNHQGPIILAGDFNTWSDERMRIVERLARRLSLSSLDYTNHNRTSVFGNALDHVFYRGLDPIEHDTWHVTSSDHNPTRVSFKVKDSFLLYTDFAASEIDENNC
ncbi:MAG: endonuclease/exonuclease/phosphatase family protein [Thiotrichales bacterium]|nr:MAG: endonuclease/exonuclease/phosphatase family protein [Thiotrichales bacterium]